MTAPGALRQRVTLTISLDVDLEQADCLPGIPSLSPEDPPASGLEVKAAMLATILAEQAREHLEGLDPQIYISVAEIGPEFPESDEF